MNWQELPADLGQTFPGWSLHELEGLTGDDLIFWSEQAGRIAEMRRAASEKPP
ncbi:hypothetical protein [Bombella apis]|uniref:hypothetical protein n=1 Tax=Bombella apis TaxID=1785988 RepID=UPI0024A9475E|nr:hypothetical protein [Bombella apis]